MIGFGKRVGARYYKRDGTPYTNNQHHAAALAWAKDMEDPKKQIVKQDKAGPFGLFWVSTVWLGINHNFGPGKPLIFETMVFCQFPRISMFPCSDLEQDRYSTEQDAEVGHMMYTTMYSEPMRAVRHIIPHIKEQWDYWRRNREERKEKEAHERDAKD